MRKRVFTRYTKLNRATKMALQRSCPNGVDDMLTTMKNVFSGELFKGLVFDYEDVTYMVEWNVKNSFVMPEFSDMEMEGVDSATLELEDEDDA